ncbi:transcriptional regulator SlyA [Hahella aquimaris]|uniref:transcriptional regulator SlyA n=1 Tax=Hahella sp. HNIBRBA332 TaxID=3015983 RepID=UPI00273CC8B4|nr:transcriptional regulator SlyA [Hahella sp. HNIBRBA332]WLQ14743.1 transcriptional regulator SlyA [Hahella sp. HNIBRBA332]
MSELFSFTLARLNRRWRKLLDDRLSDLGLTQSRWVTLLYLQRLGGDLTQKELANALSIESPTLVRLLHGLEESGLVTRTECGQDGRAKRIRLTAAAESYLETVNERAAALRSEMLAGVSPQDLELCLQVFARIEKNASEIN